MNMHRELILLILNKWEHSTFISFSHVEIFLKLPDDNDLLYRLSNKAFKLSINFFFTGNSKLEFEKNHQSITEFLEINRSINEN